MPQQLRHQLWIVAAASVVFFANLGGPALWDEDEPIYASCAREMLQRGDWVVPMYNGEMFPDKPPLMFWTMIGGFWLFGINELGARFWSAVLGIGTALATYHLGRRLFCSQIGLWAGLIVASSLAFTVSARAATVDSALVFLTTVGMLLFVVGGLAKRAKTEKSPPGAANDEPADLSFPPGSWISFVLFYTCLGLAVLAKGPIGLLLPMASTGLFLMITNHLALTEDRAEAGRPARLIGLLRVLSPRNFLRSLWQMRPVTGLVVVAAVALPWYVLVGIRTDGLWLEQFFAKYNLRPFTQPILGHSGPFWYYVPAILIGFFPWSVFMGPTLIEMVRQIRGRGVWRAGYILMACWVGVWFVFWSVCSTKLPHYVLPAYPALALVTASFLHGWVTQPTPVHRRWLRTALGIVIFVGLALAIGFPIAALIFVPGEEVLGLVGLVLVLGGGVCLHEAERGRPRRAVALFAVTCVAFVTAVFGFAALRIDRYQYARPLLATIRRHSPAEPQLAGFRFIRESVVFYAGRPVAYCEDADELRRFLDRSEHAYVFTVDEHEAELEERFPGEFCVLARRPRFLRSGEVVVLTRRTDSNAPRTAATMTVETSR